MKWWYKKEVVNIHTIDSVLFNAGKEGWELVSAIANIYGINPGDILLIFRRQKL